MKKYNKIKLLFLGFSILTFTQCVQVKPIATDKILVMEFHYDKVDGISLVDSKILDKVDIRYNNYETKHADNKLEIIFKKGVSIKIKHPLYTYVEFVNKDFSFSTAEVVLDEADFVIHYPYLTDYSEIEIREILKNNKPKTIYKFNINN